MDRQKFESHDIWNVDEAGISTVQMASKIVAVKGTKQVGALTSDERGQMITLCFAVNATSYSVPPMLVFPRKKFKDYFIRNGPNGCVGAAPPSG